MLVQLPENKNKKLNKNKLLVNKMHGTRLRHDNIALFRVIYSQSYHMFYITIVCFCLVVYTYFQVVAPTEKTVLHTSSDLVI